MQLKRVPAAVAASLEVVRAQNAKNSQYDISVLKIGKEKREKKEKEKKWKFFLTKLIFDFVHEYETKKLQRN